MRLSKTSEYALRILIYMAKEPNQSYSAKQLVDALKVSDKYLRKLMTDLSKAGFIQSIQGRDGGYIFSKAIKDICLYDVVDSVESMEKLNGCVLGFEKCSPSNPCAMHSVWKHIRDDMNKTFSETTLADMKFSKIIKY